MKISKKIFQISFFLLSTVFIEKVLSQQKNLYHAPPPSADIEKDLIISASLIGVSDPIESTLYYRLPGNKSYLEVPFKNTGFDWRATIPKFAITKEGIEYTIIFRLRNERVISYPRIKPFENPYFLQIINADRNKFEDLNSADIIILSPEPGEVIKNNEVLIAASFFNVDQIDTSSVQLFFDGINISNKMIFGDEILILDPGIIANGTHSIQIKTKNIKGDFLRPFEWSFTVGDARKITNELIKYDGDFNSRVLVEKISDVNLNIAEIEGRINVDAEWAKLSSDLRVTSRENPYSQPHNRFGTNISFGNFLKFNFGDYYPRLSPFTIDGRRVRGISIDADFNWFKVRVINGELNRSVQRQKGVDGGYIIKNGLTKTNEDGSKTFYLDRTGFAFRRDITGLRFSFDLFSKFKIGAHLMSIRDDTTSVDKNLEKSSFSFESSIKGVQSGIYNLNPFETTLSLGGHSLYKPTKNWTGVKPKDNIVIGFNLGSVFDDKRISLDFDWNVSLYNKDIWDGFLSKTALDTTLDDTLDGYIGLQYDGNGNKISGGSAVKTDQIFVDPQSLKNFFIINANMTPLLPFDLGVNPVLGIINMPSSAFSLKLRGNYLKNMILFEYRQIGPEFVSLGNPFLRNNTRQFTVSDRLNFLERKLFLNIGFKHLDNKILRTTINPLNTNTFFMNLTFLPGPGMPTFVINYQSIGKNNEKVNLDSVGTRLVDLREDSKASSNMMAVTVPFSNGEVKQNFTFSINSVNNLDDLSSKRGGGYLFPKTDSETISLNLSSLFPSKLKTNSHFSQTKLKIPSISNNKLIKTPFTWTNLLISGDYKFFDDKFLARASLSFLNSKSQFSSQLIGVRVGGDYNFQANLRVSVMGHLRFNYIKDSKGIDSIKEGMTVNSSGLISTLSYKF